MDFSYALIFFIVAFITVQWPTVNEAKQQHHSLKKVFTSILKIGQDDPLDPAVKSIVFNKKVPNLNNNAFVYALAFDLKTDDVYQTGLNLFEALEKRDQSMQEDPFAPYRDVFEQYSRYEFSENHLLCRKNEPGCLHQLINNKVDTKTFPDHYQLLIQRYQKLLDYNSFEMVQNLQMSTELPNFRSILYSQKLFHLQLLTTMPNNPKILDPIALEIKSLRKLLITADSVITKSVITDMLNESLELLSQLHQMQWLQLTTSQLNQSGISPLTHKEISYALAMQSNYESVIREFYDIFHTKDRSKIIGKKRMKPIHYFLMAYFYQPNMTINNIYQQFAVPLIEISRQDELSQLSIDREQFLEQQYDLIRNPMGAYFGLMVTGYAIPSLEYQLRTFSLNTKINLLIALVNEGSAQAIIESAENGQIKYLNPIDQSIPYIQNNKLCHSGPYENNSGYRCLTLVTK